MCKIGQDILQWQITFISSTESIATPAMPTSPATRGWSESYLIEFMNKTLRPIRKPKIPSMSGQVERNTETLLPTSQVFLVKLVAFFNCTKTGILNALVRCLHLQYQTKKSYLPNCPRPKRVH
jgi:hypothetical protein